jgi:hypothetical protein
VRADGRIKEKDFDEDEMETMAGDRRLVMTLLNQEVGIGGECGSLISRVPRGVLNKMGGWAQ